MPSDYVDAQAFPDLSSTLEILRELPLGTDPDFGIRVRASLGELDLDRLRTIIDEPSAFSRDLRFRAFYAAQVKLRRSNRYTEHQQNVERYRSVFVDEPMFKFMLAEYYGDTTGDQASRDLAIRLAREACDELPQTPGVHHLLAEYLLESIELSVGDLSEDVRQARLLEAESHVGTAISLSQSRYPKFFATRARIQSQLGMEDAALRSINVAIAEESAATEDGRARILGYQATRREIAGARLARSFRNEQESAVAEFRSLRGELLSLLGLLAAVVAFISTFTGIATSTIFPENVALILTTGGVILLVFVGFSTLFVRKPQTMQIVASVLLSFCLFAAATVFGLVL